ncbi:MAG: PKD domain-containing protein [Janthinobacterium lividum]
MHFLRATSLRAFWLLGLAGSLGLARPAAAQVQPTAQRLRAALPLGKASAGGWPGANPRLDSELQNLVAQVAGYEELPTAATLQSDYPYLQFSKGRGAPAVLVRITAQNLEALLPELQSRGFVAAAAYPALHFVEGMLPVRQLTDDGSGVTALAGRGLLGVLASLRPESNGGLVTSQADYVLEAARARATQPKQVTGAGVTIGVLSDSFNYLNGAAAGVASGDLPVVNVLSDDGSSDEGRGMCELIYDLAPGAALAFSTGNGGEGTFAQHIRDLADPAKGNCKVLVDDIRYFNEPMFQDGVIAQAVTDVVTNRGVNYFSSAGNYADKSYENAAPVFVADANGVRCLNFDVSGATTDLTQRVSIANNATFKPYMQWSDPFYTTNGVKTDLNIYLISVKNGVAADTVYRGNNRNLLTQVPSDAVSFTNNSTTTGTTTFDLVIVLRAGATPTRVKYVNYGTAIPSEWLTSSSTSTGHPSVAEGFSVAAVPYYNPKIAESFTSKAGAMTFLFAPNGTALPAGTTRQKPNIASIDGTNTSFFGGGDYESDGFQNFFGTSAAAPHAAAVAALLRSSEPTLTAAQVYARLLSSARLIGTASPDPYTGPGLLDAFTTLYGPVVAATPPVVEDLEKRALPVSWSVDAFGAARAQVTNQAPASGSQGLILDAYPYIIAQSLGEATLFLTGLTASSLQLTFRERKFPAETDELMPVSFSGHSNTDGVALSVDGGTTWYRIFDLTGTNATISYQTQTINLTQFAATNSLTLGADVRIRFQRYGRGGSTVSTAASQSGRAFDDILVTSLTPAPVALYGYTPQPAAGCPGLQVQYTDTSLPAATAWNWSFPGGTPATSTAQNPLVTYNTPGHYGVSLALSNTSTTATRADTGVVFIYGRIPQVAATTTSLSICKGGTVTFGATAVSCTTATYAWSFPGGTPAASTAQNPGAITYAVAGTYTATLTVTNTYGTYSTSFIVDVDGRGLPFAETFDSSPDLPRSWTLVTPSTYSWAIIPNIINRSGTASRVVRAPFATDPTVGEYPALNTPALNLTGVTKPTLRFDLSYAPYYSATSGTIKLDSLIVRVLDACTGTVLGKPYAKSAQNTLPTHATVSSDFFPTSATDWRQELVDLTPYAGQSVVLQFRGRNGYGNHLYIDNVNVGSNLLGLTAAAAVVGLEAWPNPTPHGSSLHLRLPAFRGDVSLRLVDNLGRVVWQQQLAQSGAALERTLDLALAPGLYNLLYAPAGGSPAARRVVFE